MQRSHIRAYFFIGVFLITCLFNQASYSDDFHDHHINQGSPLFFALEKETNNEKMARKAVHDIIEQAEREVGRIISLGIARVDLNGDGIKEIFVRLLDNDSFCEGDVCRVVGYTITEDGFIKISDFKARTIDVLNEKTQGTKNLAISLNKHKDKTIYSWQNGFYKEGH